MKTHEFYAIFDKKGFSEAVGVFFIAEETVSKHRVNFYIDISNCMSSPYKEDGIRLSFLFPEEFRLPASFVFHIELAFPKETFDDILNKDFIWRKIDVGLN